MMKFFSFQSWSNQISLIIFIITHYLYYLIFRQEKRPPRWTDSRTWASTQDRTSNDSTKAERGKVSLAERIYPTNPVTCRATKTKTPTRLTSFRFARFCDVFDTLLSRPRTLHETSSRSCLVFVILAFLDLHKALPQSSQARWTVPSTIDKIGDDRRTRWKITSIVPIVGNENLEASFPFRRWFFATKSDSRRWWWIWNAVRGLGTRSFLDNCCCRSRQCVFTHGTSGSGAFPLTREIHLLY